MRHFIFYWRSSNFKIRKFKTFGDKKSCSDTWNRQLAKIWSIWAKWWVVGTLKGLLLIYQNLSTEVKLSLNTPLFFFFKIVCFVVEFLFNFNFGRSHLSECFTEIWNLSIYSEKHLDLAFRYSQLSLKVPLWSNFCALIFWLYHIKYNIRIKMPFTVF